MRSNSFPSMLAFARPASWARACVCLSGFLGLGFHLLVRLPWPGLLFGWSGICPQDLGNIARFPARMDKHSQVFELGEWVLGDSQEHFSDFFWEKGKLKEKVN